MEFLNVNFLWNLIWVLPLLFIMALLASQRRKKLLKSVLGKRSSDQDYTNVSHNKRIFKIWLLTGIIVFLIITASRPYWGYKILPFTGSGKDILAVIDVSKSMLSKDIPPSRLEHAKLLLKKLIKSTPGDRYGIIAFAGSAFLECPLTIDRTSLFSILKDINISSIPVGGTNIEKSLKTAIKAFKAAAGGYKAIILITDGDELQGSSENVIEKLKELKTPLFVVGIGDPSKPGLIQLPAKNGQSKFLKDSKGELVKSKLNEAQLKKLAEATNGVYIRSTAVDPGLTILEKKISQLIPEKYENGKMTRPLEKYQIPLLIVVILMFIWLCVGETKRRNNRFKSNQTITLLTIATFLIILNSNLTLRADEQIPQNLNLEQQPLQASKETQSSPIEDSKTDSSNPDRILKTPLEKFNMGVTAHSKGDIKEAQKHYTDAINSSDKNKNIRSKAYQNMGVIQHAAARKAMMQNPEESLKILDKAESLYKEAMRRDSQRQEIAANQQILINDRKKAKEIIKQRKEMEKKRNEARKKTQEALQKQQQANKEKQNKKNKSNQDQQNKRQDQNKSNQQNQQNQQNKARKENQKQDSNKQQKPKTQNNKSNQLQKEANRKTQEAQKAMQDYKQAAKQNKSQKDMQAAQSASNDITNARQNQRSDKSDEAEKNLREALKKLGGQQKQNNKQDNNKQQKQHQNNQNNNKDKQKKNQQTQQKKNQAEQKTEEALKQQQKANQSQGQDKKDQQQKANKKTQDAMDAMNNYQNSAEQNGKQEDQKKAEKAKQNLQNAQKNQESNNGKQAEQELKNALKNLKEQDNNKQQKIPNQPQAKPVQPKYDNKDIDPKQAEALLKLMANEEKSLKDELKKRQKEAYGNMYISKDW